MTIVYQSKTGHTQQYAQLLHQATDMNVLPIEQAPSTLPQEEPILFMGWLKAGRISGLDQAKQCWDVRCAVGVGMAPANEAALANLQKSNPFPAESLFYLPGGWAPKQVGLFWRLAVNLVTRSTRKQLQTASPRTPEQQSYLDLLTHGGSLVSADNLSPIVQWWNAHV